MGNGALTYVFSALAFATSLGSLTVSILTYRTAGPKVALGSHNFSVFPSELWLQVKVLNTGKGEVDVDGASCDLLGPTVTALPHRLKPASSHVLQFRADLASVLGRVASVTVNIGLGNGRTLTAQVRIPEVEQAHIRRLLSSDQTGAAQPIDQAWPVPTQEEL